MSPSQREEFVMRVDQDRVMVYVLQHCTEMKRQETRLRLATGFLLLVCAAIWVYSLLSLKSGAVENQRFGEEQTSAREGFVQHQKPEKETPSCSALPISLKPMRQTLAGHAPLLQNQIKWSGNKKGGFSLEHNNTTVVVPCDGHYTLHLRVCFRIPDGHKENVKMLDLEDQEEMVFLDLSISQWHKSYNTYRDFLNIQESIPLTDHWFQAISTSHIVHLKAGMKLRVEVKENHELIQWSAHNYFDISPLSVKCST